MYELSIEREFRAAHAITIAGEREAPHDHDWRVRLIVAGPALDDDGLLCDFHELERRLDETIAPFRDVDLNRTPPFDRINPTAECVARHIGEQVNGNGSHPSLPNGATVLSVSVTEAPGCCATYRMDGR
jgi:6-pyruvoyltetrahydropterin/6-carboxytetrahydropterin synthase